MAEQKWEQAGGWVVLAAAVLAALGYLVRKARQTVITLGQASAVFEQLLGDRKASPPTPSLVERVADLQRQLKQQGEQLAQLHDQLDDQGRRLMTHIERHDGRPNRVRHR